MIIPIRISRIRAFRLRMSSVVAMLSVDALARITPRTMLVCPFFPVYRLRNRNRHLDIAVRLVVAGRTFPAEALASPPRKSSFSLAHGVGVFHNAKIAVDNQHTAVIQVGHLLQLGIDDIGGWILQVVVIDQVICDNPVLGRDVRAAQIHRTFFVIIQNAQAHDVAGHDSDDQHQEENVGLQAAEDRNFISEPPE